jgi:hypothetical protein
VHGALCTSFADYPPGLPPAPPEAAGGRESRVKSSQASSSLKVFHRSNTKETKKIEKKRREGWVVSPCIRRYK